MASAVRKIPHRGALCCSSGTVPARDRTGGGCGNPQNAPFSAFYLPTGSDPSDYEQEIADRLGQMTEAAGEAGVTCWLENEKGVV